MTMPATAALAAVAGIVMGADTRRPCRQLSEVASGAAERAPAPPRVRRRRRGLRASPEASAGGPESAAGPAGSGAASVPG
ncbi:hypothetical protein, partial [Streptomyces sp. CNQ085]|uniref:hypothetical protein n=1 Tax=Streptomyces sp. CNQ085 TaxID=2886944 RepID=UPI001F509041